ncbi:hypothetical protein ACFQ0M_47825 [Kitasatospora aburaviensis]
MRSGRWSSTTRTTPLLRLEPTRHLTRFPRPLPAGSGAADRAAPGRGGAGGGLHPATRPVRGHHLRPQRLRPPAHRHRLLLFADNVDPSHTALARLLDATDPDHPAFLAAPFSISGAQSHGVVICSGSGTVRTMAGLVEKPGAQQAARLADEHGADNLRLLQGRGRITPDLLHHLAATSRHASTHIEPKLALALAAYARRRPVQIVTSSAAMVDLGAPEPDAAAA